MRLKDGVHMDITSADYRNLYMVLKLLEFNDFVGEQPLLAVPK